MAGLLLDGDRLAGADRCPSAIDLHHLAAFASMSRLPPEESERPDERGPGQLVSNVFVWGMGQ
jgi:hypothetical protein